MRFSDLQLHSRFRRMMLTRKIRISVSSTLSRRASAPEKSRIDDIEYESPFSPDGTPQTPESTRVKRFHALLREAEDEFVSGRLKKSSVFQLQNCDRVGTVMTVVGRRIGTQNSLHDTFLEFLHIIQSLDFRPFVVVYCHTGARFFDRLAFHCLKTFYKQLPQELRKSIQKLIVVHPCLLDFGQRWCHDIILNGTQVQSMEELQQHLGSLSVNVTVPMFVSRHGKERSPLFGGSLANALSRSRTDIPTVCHVCCNWIESHGLKVEGIFRIPGEKMLIDSLIEDFEHDGDIDDMVFESVHDCASVLKRFLSNLQPEALVPSDFYQEFVSIDDFEGDEVEKISRLRDLFNSIPLDNYRILLYLFRFLNRIVEHSEYNFMNASNLAVVFSPGICRGESHAGQSEMLKSMKAISSLVGFCINHFEAIFSTER